MAPPSHAKMLAIRSPNLVGRSSGAHSRCSIPMRCASAAKTRSPVSSRSRAGPTPIVSTRRAMPRQAGLLPSRGSRKPTRHAAVPIRMSQASASYKPPPSAGPSTAATTGTGRSASAWKARLPKADKRCASLGLTPAHSLRSAPAQNIGDVDRRSTTRTAASREEISAASSSSIKKASSRALRFSGRSSQSVRQPRSTADDHMAVRRFPENSRDVLRLVSYRQRDL
jgi:hypothetical protein